MTLKFFFRLCLYIAEVDLSAGRILVSIGRNILEIDRRKATSTCIVSEDAVRQLNDSETKEVHEKKLKVVEAMLMA